MASRLTRMICVKVAEYRRREEQEQSVRRAARREGGPAKFPCQFPANAHFVVKKFPARRGRKTAI